MVTAYPSASGGGETSALTGDLLDRHAGSARGRRSRSRARTCHRPDPRPGLLDISRQSSGHPGPRGGMSPADRVDGLSPCRNSGSAFDRFGWIVRWCFGVQLRGCRPGYRGTGGATADLFPTRVRRIHGGTNRTNSQPYPIGLAYGPRERSSGIRQGYGDTLSGRALMQVSACVRSIGIGYAVKVCSRPGARAYARADLILDTRNYKTPHKWGVRGGRQISASRTRFSPRILGRLSLGPTASRNFGSNLNVAGQTRFARKPGVASQVGGE